MRRLTLMIFAGMFLGLNLWAIPPVLIRQEDVPNFIGQYAIYDQNPDLFEWLPFDSMKTWWSFDTFPTGRYARMHLLPRTAGIPPAPDTFPNSQMLELDTLGSGDVTWLYLTETQFYFYVDGMDFETGGFRFIGNYRPDYKCYSYPIYDGAGWNTAWTWTYEVAPDLPYTANEQHEKVVVAAGKVKVPFSGNHYWPCLVIRDHMSYYDNFGTNDTRWIYEWVVPGRFGGGNGVAAAQSQNGAGQNFMIVENFFKLNQLYVPGWDLRCPDFASTTVWPDTAFLGPYLVKTTITDSTGVGVDSLFYRINHGAFAGVGSDSIIGNDYFYTIPAVAQACTLGYFLWAEDSFSFANAVDIWNTDPICAPESTYYRFLADVGIEEQGASTVTFLKCSPNPFRHATRISVGLRSATQFGGEELELRIFNISGRLVKTLDFNSSLNPNSQFLIWAGDDERGRSVPAGVYFITLEHGRQNDIERVILVR